jgi:hypothetical protein
MRALKFFYPIFTCMQRALNQVDVEWTISFDMCLVSICNCEKNTKLEVPTTYKNDLT